MPQKPILPRRARPKPPQARRAQPRPPKAAGQRKAAIDEYLAAVPADRRRALQALRRLLHAIEPAVEECISYGMPAFRVGGKVIAGFAATKKGCSYFPFSGSTLGSLAKDLAGYEQTKSALHFTSDAPLPEKLVRKLLRARIAEIGGDRTAP